MSYRISFVLLLAFTLPTFAQPDRYELGKRVRDLEIVWEEKALDRDAKRRAAPLINKAVESFFSFNFPGAARSLDEARFALGSKEPVSTLMAWAESLQILPQSRLIDASQKEFSVAIRPFYKVEAPPDRKLLVRVKLGNLVVKEVTLGDLPFKIDVPTEKFPGGRTTDLKLIVEFLSEDKLLATKNAGLSRVENLEDRIEKLKDFKNHHLTKTVTIESQTIIHNVQLISSIANKITPETDYPVAALIEETEKVIQTKGAFYDLNRSGEFWLSLPTPKMESVVRISIPRRLDREKPVPALIALHGMGGSENMYFDAYGNGIIPKLGHERGWIVVGTRVNGLLGAGSAPNVPAILDELSKRYPIDTKKVYLIGHSMGAGHTIQLAQQQPHRYAAIATLGGGGRVTKADSFKEMPCFVGCGSMDFALRGSRMLAETLKQAKANVLYKEYPDIEHLTIVQESAKDVFAFFENLNR